MAQQYTVNTRASFQSSTPVQYGHRTPATTRQPAIQPYGNQEPYQQPSTYRHPVIRDYNLDRQQPVIRNYRTPLTDVSFQTTVDYQQPTSGGVPFNRSYRTPLEGRYPFANRQPNIRDRQTPSPYIANRQNPFNRSYQNPYAYQASDRQPTIYNAQIAGSYQHQSPSEYQHRSPFTYQNPVNAQNPYIANAQSNQPYQIVYQVAYSYRSPSTYQITYNSQRPITQVAEAKAIYIKDADGVVKKVNKAYVKNNSTDVEQIHQSIPYPNLNT